MSNESIVLENNKKVKRTFWGATAFYILIAFEFFYMASPFAVYFYGVYRPGLNFFNQSPVFGWLVSFFMPHAVIETSSSLINMHNIIGGILTVGGLIGFVIGASQVYYHKLARKGAVTGGIYNYIRHPQYASFIISSFGLLILWPRYIVLVMFVVMLFAYYLLAKVEEGECERKFGESYIEYKKKTGMFLPFKLPLIEKFSLKLKSRPRRLLSMVCIFSIILAGGLGLAKFVNNYALQSLYAVYTNASATISIGKLEKNKIETILNIALSNTEVKSRIEAEKTSEKEKLLNYILPSEWYVAEIPMNGIGTMGYHRFSSNYDSNVYKIIFTKAEMRSENVTGKNIIQNVTTREVIAEVWVNVSESKVIQIYDKPDNIMYDSIPVAVY